MSRNSWRDGTTHILFEPVELLERLAALVPAPRTHLVKYHGVLGPCAGWRDRVVPDPAGGVRSVLLGELSARRRGDGAASTATAQGREEGSTSVAAALTPAASEGGPPLAATEEDILGAGERTSFKNSRRRNRSWADLMRHVFELDVLACPRCGGRLRVLAAIQDPDAIGAILACLGLASRPPPPPGPTVSDGLS